MQSSLKAKEKYFDEFNPAMLEIVVTPPSPLGRTIVYSILSIILVVIIWAQFSTVEIVARGEARAIYTSRVKDIQPAYNSIIQEIHVVEGQTVDQDELLVTFDTKNFVAEARTLEYQIEYRIMDIVRLAELLKAIESSNFDDRILDFPQNVDEVIAKEQQLRFSSRVRFLAGRIKSSNRQIKNLQDENMHLADTIELTTSIVSDLKTQLEDSEKLHKIGAETKTRVQEIRHDLFENRRKLSQSQYLVRNNQSEIDIIRNQIQNQKNETQQETIRELAIARESYRSLEDQLIKIKNRISLNKLSAPISGTVEEIKVHTQQGVVTAGSTIMTVIPFDSPIEFEVRISNSDIGFVEISQPVNIKFDAFPFERYGILKGKVSSIARNSVEIEEGSGEWAYLVRVAPNEQSFSAQGRNLPITSGMTGTVDIVTGTRTVMSFLIDPVIREAKLSLSER